MINYTFTQQFTGVVHCYAVPSMPHCGLTAGYQDFPLTLRAEYGNCELDRSGFLLDNNWFNIYCETLRGIHLRISCERLLMQIAEDCLAADPRIQSVEISIVGVPNTLMTIRATRAADRKPYQPDPVASKRQDMLSGNF